MAISDLTKQWQGYDESSTPDSFVVNAVYTCPWADRETSKAELLDGSNSDFTWLICTDVKTTPFGTVDPAGGPLTAKLSVNWKNPSLANTAGKDQVKNNWSLWTEHWEGATEALTMKRGLYWSDGSGPISKEDVEPFILLPLVQLTLSGKTDKISKVNLLGTAGKVNAKAVTIKGYSYPTETLLFEGADLDDGNPPDSDTTVWNLTYKFVHRPTNWNKYFNPALGSFRYVDDMNNAPPYTLAQFSDLDPNNW